MTAPQRPQSPVAVVSPPSSQSSPMSQSSSTAVAPLSAQTGASAMMRASGGGNVVAFDPFLLMDRLDADAVVAEMEGIAIDTLVYRVKDGAREHTALSKGGIDECCTMLVSQGQCIREESITLATFGEGEEQEAIFTCVAARYAVDGASGREIKLDQVIGVKREPVYEQRAPLTLDSKVPGKKWRHVTFEQALEIDEAVGYLEWIRDASTFDDATKRFVTALLAGEDVREFAAGKRYNPFWYEHGAMKAARNARMRLVPAGLKAQVIALANANGRVREVSRDGGATAAPAAATQHARATMTKSPPQQLREKAATQATQNFDNGTAMVFPYGPLRERGATLDARYHVGATRVKKGKNGAADETIDVGGHYVVSDARIAEAREWLSGKLRKHLALEESGATSGDGWLDERDIQKLALWDDELRDEQERRRSTDVQEQPPERAAAPLPDRAVDDRAPKQQDSAANEPTPQNGAGAVGAALDDVSCPKCGGRMLDNRLSKRNPKAPDFKCRSRSCDGVIWPARPEGYPANERSAGAPTDGDVLDTLDEAFNNEDDDLPF